MNNKLATALEKLSPQQLEAVAVTAERLREVLRIAPSQETALYAWSLVAGELTEGGGKLPSKIILLGRPN